MGPYQILEPLGAGGMGEVYRARDTTLERDVAIKVLPDDLATDPERLARLEREAKLLASLNHPNIATIFSLEDHEETRFIVLELIKGESLEQLLTRGPLETGKALELCKQIAEALEAAHGEGIIHRDLKPANVLITADGRAKVLDFGIAKSLTVDAEVAHTSGPTNLTVTGVLVGTPCYMSPEQIRGEPIDRRADIWAFGCLLYETLTAEKAFARDTLADTLAAIVDQEPDWSRLDGKAPPAIRQLIARCLRKAPRRRLRDVGDAWVALEETVDATADGTLAGATAPAGEAIRPAPAGVPWPAAGAAAIALAMFAALAAWYVAGPAESPSRNVVRFTIALPEVWPGDVAVSPHGTHLVYVGHSGGMTRLYLRSMNDPAWSEIEGTEGASRPFFSPDGEWVGYSGGTSLLKVSIAGGEPFRLCRLCVDETADGNWSPDGETIFFEFDDAVWRVSANGGDPRLVVEPNTEEGVTAYERPHVLPDGRSALLEVYRDGQAKPSVAIVDLGTNRLQTLAEGGAPEYSETGHVLYVRDTSLYALPFDATSGAATDEPVPMVQGVRTFSFSRDGTLAFTNPLRSDDPADRSVVWVDRQGRFTRVSDDLRAYERVNLGPDGKRAAVTIQERDRSNVWILDLVSGALTQLTFDGGDSPVWSPDDDWIAYVSTRRAGGSDIHRIFPARVDIEPELMVGSERALVPNDVSRDGRWLLYTESSPPNGRDIKALPLGEPGAPPFTVISTERDEMTAAISPDGDRIAFMRATQPSTWDVFVAEFPRLGATVQVSTGGACCPVWSPDGRQLFMVSDEGPGLMVADLATDGSLESTEPRPLFRLGQRVTFSLNTANRLDISADGEQFLLVEQMTEFTTQREINVVVNWFEKLKQRSPAGG